MTSLASVVDTGALLKVIAVSLVATAVLAGSLGYGILGASRSAELRRQGREGAATAYGVLGLLALLVMTAAVVLGLIVMTRK